MDRLAGIRCVLFDAVGTLLYADPPVAQAYYQAARRHGSHLAMDEIQRRFRAALNAEHRPDEPTSEAQEEQRWRRIVAHALSDIPAGHDAVFAELWQHFAQPQHWRLFDDVPTVWSALLHHRYSLGIASNFDQRLRQVIASHPPLATCQHVFVSSEIGYLKPDPRFFRAVEQGLGLPPSKIALVGDDEIADFQGATAAGWRAIRLDRNGFTAKRDDVQTLSALISPDEGSES